jgi:hypothetical protein
MKFHQIRAFLESPRCIAWFVGVLATVDLSFIGASFYRHLRYTPSVAQIASIVPGMTQQQVRQILGTSLNGSPDAQTLHTATFNGYPLEVGSSVTWVYPTPFDFTAIEGIFPGEQLCICFSSRGFASSISYDD